MTGIRGLKALSLFIALPITGFLLGDTILKTPSVADCTFHSDPDRFTAPERRVRRALNDRVVALTRGLKRDDHGHVQGRDHAGRGAERDAAAGVSAQGDGGGRAGGRARAGRECHKDKRGPLSPRGRGSG